MGSSLKAQSNHSKTKLWLPSPPTGSNSPNQSLVPILVCPGRHNKIPHTEQLKQQAIFKQTKKKAYFPHTSGSQNSLIKTRENSVSGAGSLPGFQTATTLLWAHVTFPQHMCMEKEGE